MFITLSSKSEIASDFPFAANFPAWSAREHRSKFYHDWFCRTMQKNEKICIFLWIFLDDTHKAYIRIQKADAQRRPPTISTFHSGADYRSFHILTQRTLAQRLKAVSYTHLDVYKRQTVFTAMISLPKLFVSDCTTIIAREKIACVMPLGRPKRINCIRRDFFGQRPRSVSLTTSCICLLYTSIAHPEIHKNLQIVS